MTDVYILQNHDGLYLDKHSEWTEGRDANSLYRTIYKDEAVNQRLELTVRDPNLRITVVECRLDDKGRPAITRPDTTDAQATAASQSTEPSLS